MKHYKLLFSTFDRITIPIILPNLSKYEIGVVVNNLRKKISLNENEISYLELKVVQTNDGQTIYNWNKENEETKEFALNQIEFDMIRGSLTKLNNEEKLPINDNWLALYDKFVKKTKKIKMKTKRI